MSSSTMKVFGLVRVSSYRQRDNARYSFQESTIRAEAKRRNWDIEIIHEVRSAKDMSKRPILLSLIQRLNNGEASRLLVLTSDRLTRSIDDACYILKTAKNFGWVIHPLDLNPDYIPTEVWYKQFRDAINNAHFELDVLSKRTKEGIRDCGKVLGNARFKHSEDLLKRVKYLRNIKKLSHGKIAIVLNKEKFPIVKSFGTSINCWTADKVATACKHIN